MANLIITIISIGLVAVAAIMGAYYGGQAFQQGQINAIANSIISESQQILTAQRMWATNNNQPDATNAILSTLISAHELAECPAIGGNQLGYTPNCGWLKDAGCYNYSGYQGQITRSVMTYNNANYITYSFKVNTPYNGNCNTGNGSFTSFPNHPIMLIAAAINSKLGVVTPTGGSVTNGIINGPGTWAGAPASMWTPASIYGGSVDGNGTMVSNMCYWGAGIIVCIFGPS